MKKSSLLNRMQIVLAPDRIHPLVQVFMGGFLVAVSSLDCWLSVQSGLICLTVCSILMLVLGLIHVVGGLVKLNEETG